MSSYILSDTLGRIGIPGDTGFILFDTVPPSLPATRIFYGGRTVDLPAPPFRWQANPAPPRTVNTTLTGRVETICSPRMDIRITGEFRLVESATLRKQLWNFWQWASRGLPWAITLDYGRCVHTSLTQSARAGDTEIHVRSVNDIAIGGLYKLFGGPNYRFVQVTSVDGLTLTLAEALEVPFTGVGDSANAQYAAHLRDPNYFIGSIRDVGTPLPIVDMGPDDNVPQPLPQATHKLVLDFFEYHNDDLG